MQARNLNTLNHLLKHVLCDWMFRNTVSINFFHADISLDVNITFAEGTAQLVQCIDDILVHQDDVFEGTERIDSNLFNITTTYNGVTDSYLGGSIYIADRSGELSSLWGTDTHFY